MSDMLYGAGITGTGIDLVTVFRAQLPYLPRMYSGKVTGGKAPLTAATAGVTPYVCSGAYPNAGRGDRGPEAH